MNWRITKGYLLTVPCGLVIIAGVVLLALQWDMKSSFLLYGKNLDQTNTAALIVASMLVGFVLPYILKGLLRGIALINAERGKKAEIQKPLQAASPTPVPNTEKNVTQGSTRADRENE